MSEEVRDERDEMEDVMPMERTDVGADLVNDAGELRARWEQIQTTFVDEPRQAVEEADQLVATVVEQLSRSFHDQRDSLERDWSAGDEVSTEALRQALQRYRSFFERLLAA